MSRRQVSFMFGGVEVLHKEGSGMRAFLVMAGVIAGVGVGPTAQAQVVIPIDDQAGPAFGYRVQPTLVDGKVHVRIALDGGAVQGFMAADLRLKIGGKVIAESKLALQQDRSSADARARPDRYLSFSFDPGAVGDGEVLIQSGAIPGRINVPATLFFSASLKKLHEQARKGAEVAKDR
jgi:hypothetical protein